MRVEPTDGFFGEVVFASIVPLTWILLPSVGLEGAGWAAVGGSVVSLGYYAWQVQRVQAVRMEVSIVRRIIAIFLFLLLTTMAFSVGPWVGLGIGLAGTLAAQ